MNSFLITFKPATETPERGWPLETLQRLVHRQRSGETVEERWRFINRKDVSNGDRVFLLCQGKMGPAIIGYGKVSGEPENSTGKWRAAGHFEHIVDPTTEVFANRVDLFAIKGAARFWRTQASGVRLPENIAVELERLVVGKPPKPVRVTPVSNPDWTRDELILALDFYLNHRPNPPGKESQEILGLSRDLNRLGEKLFPPESRTGTFRNENGVYMKLMNFRRLDPQYTLDGKKGLTRGAKAEEEVWADFGSDARFCQRVAKAIIASLDDSEVSATWIEPNIDEGVQEAAEGRLLTRMHVVRERNRHLGESKRKQTMTRNGKLVCEACDFNFADHYGERGEGFIECHHMKPIASFSEGHRTHINDLALVCANCHRIIHRGKHWLTVAEVRVLVNKARSTGRNRPSRTSRPD